ncbi:Hypothetical protein R9X50_00549900 [Acrodontium crateriforme]|uniref:Tudor domain-containing protein n=1 Tax=Acrodontium crateriforme TaxID=150365 RepID=A0AAQ3M785_9PEZI|nr:Hypothetical protein R9X50_00549900 [Acrodontium crateriforme]
MSILDKLVNELAAYQDDIATCDEMLAMEPTDEDALTTKAAIEEQIAELNMRITAERRKQAANAPPPPPLSNDTPPPPPKFDMTKHPKFQGNAASTPPPPPLDDAQPATFEVRDQVMAKYSADKQWYQATIVTKTGSSTDPVYTVNFKGYGDIETKRKYEIRPMENKKRKADGTPVTSTTPQAPASPRPNTKSASTISAPPLVDPTLVQKREPSKVSDGPTRLAPEPKRLKGNKALDKQKGTWKDWQANGPKKSAYAMPKRKESQFRTPDAPGAKVGFVGSGKPMSKDQARSKWAYDAKNNADDE